MSDLRAMLERLVPPPAHSSFHEELWDRIQERERAAARFWRTAAVAIAVVALAAASAAGVLAVDSGGPTVVDRTLACSLAPNGQIALFAHVKGPTIRVHEAGNTAGKLVPHPALVELDTGRSVILNAGIFQVAQTTLAGAYSGASLTAKAGYTLGGSGCLGAKTIPLAPSGLHSAGVFSGGGASGVYRECAVAQPATLRMRVTLAKNGLPVAAKLAIRSGKKLRPVAYIDWTPTRVRAWLAPGCEQYSGELAP